MVNEAFVEFLEKVVGKEVVDTFKEDHPVGFLQFMMQFEQKKKVVKNDPTDQMSIEIPFAMHEAAVEVTRKRFADLVKEKQLQGVESNKSGMLIIGADVIQNIFKKSVQGIVDYVTTLLQDSHLADVSQILMVGGYSESAILQSAIRSAFKGRVLVPADASLCVLKGAVAFGHNPTIVTSRVARKTYV